MLNSMRCLWFRWSWLENNDDNDDYDSVKIMMIIILEMIKTKKSQCIKVITRAVSKVMTQRGPDPPSFNITDN